ncbi:hypothetical protein P12x_000167 [Tundrisphaera lichenicola]|uniref:hypothetical protein n=1 Tax=Tundrisphaera lichenicola TaxID=2029860 RepID=UPI003EBC46FC
MMIRERRWTRRDILPYLMACTSIVAIQGCGDGPAQPTAAPKNENNAMAEFMKNKQASKKKKKR